MKKFGFTIVELLIVVLIITVLAGLLLPVLASAKHSANATTAAQNMKSIVQAALIYRNDHDNWPRSSVMQKLLPTSVFLDPRSDQTQDKSNSHPFRIYSYAWRPEYANANQSDCAGFGVTDSPNVALIGSPLGDKRELKLKLGDAYCDVGVAQGLRNIIQHCGTDLDKCHMPKQRLLGFEDGSVRSIKVNSSTLLFDWLSYLRSKPFQPDEL